MGFHVNEGRYRESSRNKVFYSFSHNGGTQSPQGKYILPTVLSSFPHRININKVKPWGKKKVPEEASTGWYWRDRNPESLISWMNHTWKRSYRKWNFKKEVGIDYENKTCSLPLFLLVDFQTVLDSNTTGIFQLPSPLKTNPLNLPIAISEDWRDTKQVRKRIQTPESRHTVWHPNLYLRCNTKYQ